MITIHILSNISRSKDNQTIKFGQLLKYNMKKLISKNHTQNVVGKVVPGPFLKYQN